MYEELSPYERALARFGDKCALIAGLELNGKISPEDAYQKIKEMYKELKSFVKKKEMNGTTKSRICTHCKTEKPLNSEHYQVVKSFSSGFSYFCNECNLETRKVGKK